MANMSEERNEVGRTPDEERDVRWRYYLSIAIHRLSEQTALNSLLVDNGYEHPCDVLRELYEHIGTTAHHGSPADPPIDAPLRQQRGVD